MFYGIILLKMSMNIKRKLTDVIAENITFLSTMKSKEQIREIVSES